MTRNREYSRIFDRNRLYRNRENALLAGVCAGIADWSGLNLTALRVSWVLLAIPFTPVMLIGYIVLALLLPVRPDGLYHDADEEQFWRETRRSPVDSVAGMSRRFRELDRRLQRMETWLTSREYRFKRELRD